MKIKIKLVPLAVLLTLMFSSQAGAVIFNFIDLTENRISDGDPYNGLGESSWSSLSAADHAELNHFGFKVTGHATNDDDGNQFAYLDWGNAGLGVCKDAVGAPSGNNSGSSANSCAPRSDDNVTVGEYLDITFTESVRVDNIWLNNNHDGGFDANDKVTIGVLSQGLMDYSVMTGYAGGANGIGPFTMGINDVLRVAYKNEEFYMSGMAVSAVPVPAAFWLFGTALIGFVGYGRRTSV